MKTIHLLAITGILFAGAAVRSMAAATTANDRNGRMVPASVGDSASERPKQTNAAPAKAAQEIYTLCDFNTGGKWSTGDSYDEGDAVCAHRLAQEAAPRNAILQADYECKVEGAWAGVYVRLPATAETKAKLARFAAVRFYYQGTVKELKVELKAPGCGTRAAYCQASGAGDRWQEISVPLNSFGTVEADWPGELEFHLILVDPKPRTGSFKLDDVGFVLRDNETEPAGQGREAGRGLRKAE